MTPRRPTTAELPWRRAAFAPISTPTPHTLSSLEVLMRVFLCTLATVLVAASTACNDGPSPAEPVPVAQARTMVAAQGPPTDVDETPFTVDFCGFPIQVVLSGKAKTIDLPNGSTIMTAPGLTVTLTNPANGSQETLNITGALHQRTLENGDVEIVSTGRSALFAPAVPGLVLVIGKFSYIVDAVGNLVQPLQGTGQLIDLCELLS
jgi:hypothetical protein